MKLGLLVLVILPALPSLEQSQSCPLNINFSAGALTHWEAYTGNNKGGNGPDAIRITYDSSRPTPSGTDGAAAFPEYNLPGVNGIRVITNQGTDAFGGFPAIPTINGYAYHYSILLGSTSVSRGQASDPSNNQPVAPTPVNTGAQGGYVRGISYRINVPPGPPTLPYTMTYAYAMVLENGTHASLDQPMARAIVSTSAGVITCASPEYYLPTNGGGLDSATARANGFSPSHVPSPNPAANPLNAGEHLFDIWTKAWTEVTFDLSPYRGQQVSLTFEADNCVPGGHFAYAYFALRDDCAGLQVSGDTLACTNSTGIYSIPALDSATYDWSVPDGWSINTGSNGNIVGVTIGPQSGWIVAREKNSCASLVDSLFVHLYPGALPQATVAPRDTTVCHGEPASLHALITAGTEYAWTSPGLFSGRNKGAIAAVPFASDLIVTPDETEDYILNIRNEGCPIPVYDTVTVNVVPPIRVNAGNDTVVVADEPLQFRATSSDPYKDRYQWTPSAWLSNPDTSAPVGLYASEVNSIIYQVTATDSFGCYGAASVKVTIAHTLPDIFVPNAFTPGLSSNSVFRPVCIGISSLDFFRVYNRWGQLVFSTSQMGQGWDGRIEGRLQESNVYLWLLRGTDYTGRVISKKGTAVLVR